jgi:anti-sigma factor RsiW
MSQCWPEGALRAQLDRELAPDEMDRVTAHLGECAECARLSAELAARAQRVGAWLQELPGALPAELPAPPLEWVAAQATGGRRWIGVAAALAAGLVLAALSLPRHVPRQKDADAGPAHVAVSAPGRNLDQANLAVTGELPTVVALPARTAALPGLSTRRVRRPRLLGLRPQARTVSNEFLALDDEPIETGVVMRVGVEPGNMQADVVFGPDGRAHAIRLVSTRN